MSDKESELKERIAALEAENKRLKEDTAKFKYIVDNSYHWEYWINPDKTLRYTSPSCHRITGFGPEAFMEDPQLLHQIIHPEDQEQFFHHYDSTLWANQDHGPMDFRIITASNEIRWLSHSCRPVYDDKGNFLGRRGSNWDITRRKAVEDQLHINEARYRYLFDGMATCAAVYTVSDDGNTFIFKSFNRASEEATGRNTSEVEGESVQTIFPNIIEMGLLDVFKQVYRTGKPQTHPMSHYEDNRITLWVENYVYRLPNGEIVALYENLTSGKQAEEELKLRLKELESFHQLSLATSQAHEPKQVIETALDQIKAIIEPDLAILYLVEGDQMVLQDVRTDLPQFEKEQYATHAIGECLCGMSAIQAAPLFSMNICKDDRCTHRECKRAGIHSYAALPLMSGMHLMGVLGIGSCHERDFELQASFLNSLAALIALGIANAQLNQRLKKHAEDLETTVQQRTEALDKFYNAVEHCPASIVITDLSGRIEYVNPFFAQLTGYTVEEAMGQTPAILKSGHHPPSFYETLWKTLNAGKAWRGEICNRKKDGSLYWEDASISPLRDRSGTVTHFVGVKEDITAPKAAKKTLLESEYRYKSIFNNTQDGIFIFNRISRKVHIANEAAGKIFGYLEKSLLEKRMEDLHPMDERPGMLEKFSVPSSKGVQSYVEMPCLKNNGTIFYCDITTTTLEMDNTPCIVFFYRDVTERTRIRALEEDVERILRHDLKSPLSAVIGFPKMMLKDKNLTTDQKKYLQHILDAGQTMLDLINFSMTLHQIENETYQFNGAGFNLLTIVNRCINHFQSLCNQKKITFHLTMESSAETNAESIIVIGDQLMAFSIFSNLIKNAVEASSPQNSVSIHIKNRTPIEVTIHNSGAVPEEIRHRFFEKYVSQGKTRGTGLGTYSAKLMTEAQGWRIAMESSEEIGTVLRLTIP